MNKKLFLFISLFLAIIAINAALFIVDQRQQAIILQLGEFNRQYTKPGLHFKIPFFEKVVFYDNRILDINVEPQEVIANDRKRLIVDAFAKYRINNPLKYYQSVGNDSGLAKKFNRVLEASIREEIGRVSLVDLISSKRANVMDAIRKSANLKSDNYGITILDVRIMRTDLPPENSQAIFERMKAQHEKEARQTRAEGAEKAIEIQSTADKDKRIILAEANKQSQILRGEGDQIATKIFANAFKRDPDFFKFYRTMQAYRRGLKADGTKLVLSPNSDFLQYFNSMNGKRSKQ